VPAEIKCRRPITPSLRNAAWRRHSLEMCWGGAGAAPARRPADGPTDIKEHGFRQIVQFFSSCTWRAPVVGVFCDNFLAYFAFYFWTVSVSCVSSLSCALQ